MKKDTNPAPSSDRKLAAIRKIADAIQEASNELLETCVPDKEPQYHIIRGDHSGVHVGVLKAREGREVTLGDARRIHYWTEANTLNEISLRGVGEKGSRISEPVPEITLLDALEVLPCSPAARDNLTRSRWRK